MCLWRGRWLALVATPDPRSGRTEVIRKLGRSALLVDAAGRGVAGHDRLPAGPGEPLACVGPIAGRAISAVPSPRRGRRQASTTMAAAIPGEQDRQQHDRHGGPHRRVVHPSYTEHRQDRTPHEPDGQADDQDVRLCTGVDDV